MELHRRQEAFGVLGVVGENLRAELDLAASLVDALAHLERHGVRERVGLSCMQQFGRLGHDDRPLGIGLVPPGLEAALRRPRAWSQVPCRSALEPLQSLPSAGLMLW